jgi:hypothetical protein
VARRGEARSERQRAGSRSARDRAKRGDDLALVGKAAGLVLRIDANVAGKHVEDAAAAANQFRIVPQLRLDLGRQTGGPREIVSDAAVVNDDVHFVSLALIRTAVMLS